MIRIWWPGFIVPALMLLCGLLGRCIPGFHYRSPRGKLEGERQAFADRQLLQLLRQFGCAFAALAFMVMNSVRLLPETVQNILLCALTALELIGAVLTSVPVERALKAAFDAESDEDKGELA